MGFRVSFGWFGLHGLWFAGLVWSVWTPRFQVEAGAYVHVSMFGSFVRFGLQGLVFQGFVRRVWSPRFRVSGFRLAGLGSKVSVCRESP